MRNDLPVDRAMCLTGASLIEKLACGYMPVAACVKPIVWSPRRACREGVLSISRRSNRAKLSTQEVILCPFKELVPDDQLQGYRRLQSTTTGVKVVLAEQF